MFHTQAAWRSDDAIDVFRAISGIPTLQRFSLVEILSNMPTYQVDIAFFDEEGEQCWRKFFCTEISKIAKLVLGDDFLKARISVISVGTLKNIVVGEGVFEIFEISKAGNSPFYFCRTASGTLLSDGIHEISSTISESAKLIWQR